MRQQPLPAGIGAGERDRLLEVAARQLEITVRQLDPAEVVAAPPLTGWGTDLLVEPHRREREAARRGEVVTGDRLLDAGQRARRSLDGVVEALGKRRRLIEEVVDTRPLGARVVQRLRQGQQGPHPGGVDSRLGLGEHALQPLPALDVTRAHPRRGLDHHQLQGRTGVALVPRPLQGGEQVLPIGVGAAALLGRHERPHRVVAVDVHVAVRAPQPAPAHPRR